MIAFALAHCACGPADNAPLADTPEDDEVREALLSDDAHHSIDCEPYHAIKNPCAEEWGKPVERVQMSCEEECSGRGQEAPQPIADCLDSSKDCTKILASVVLWRPADGLGPRP